MTLFKGRDIKNVRQLGRDEIARRSAEAGRSDDVDRTVAETGARVAFNQCLAKHGPEFTEELMQRVLDEMTREQQLIREGRI